MWIALSSLAQVLLLPEEVLQMTAAIETLRCMALETGDLFLTFYLTMLYQAFFWCERVGIGLHQLIGFVSSWLN